MLSQFTAQIANLNDTGAALLIAGRHQEGKELLCHCSRIIKTTLATVHQELKKPKSQQAFWLPNVGNPSVGVLDAPLFDSAMSDLQQKEFFIYNRPFLLGSILPLLVSWCKSGPGFTAAMRVCSAASIFNMALAFHHRAVQQGSQEAAENAEKLYLCILELLMLSDDINVIATDEVFLLAVAASNNVSHIRIMRQGACSETAAAAVKLLQNCVLPTLTRGERLQSVSQLDWERICSNLHALSTTKSVISAAAA